MTPPDMSVPATEVYEIVLEEPGGPKSWFRNALTLVLGLMSQLTAGDGPQNPGGMILSVRSIETGEELFRHIEDMGDDDGHLLDGIQKDLAEMTAAEFKTRWVD